MKYTYRKSQSGYSLIELSISLAIVAVILVGGLTGVQRILRANALNNEIKTVNEAVNAIVTGTLRANSFAGISTAAAIALGAFPTNRVNANGTVGNEFDGGTTVVNSLSVAFGNYGADQLMIYTLNNVPRASCMSLVQGVEPLAAAITVHLPGAVDATAVPAALNATNEGLVKTPPANTTSLANLTAACTTNANNFRRVSLYVARR